VPQEIERKFLVANDGWRGDALAGLDLLQAYLCETERAVVRLRLVDRMEAFLTVKSAEAGLSRAEFEYPLPVEDAEALMQLRQGSVLAKTRFYVTHSGRRWELDVYSGENEGLVIAEIELESAQDSIDLPPWLGREVTGEAPYYASRLARQPFRSWANHLAAQDRHAGGIT
jgi:adenylate cyclase